ncbi:MAG: hypothetical protein AB7D36_05155 [Oscillospiraceae bacterium]
MIDKRIVNGKVQRDALIDKRNQNQTSQKAPHKKNKDMERPEDVSAYADGGVMLTTSEILDFSEGTDSEP